MNNCKILKGSAWKFGDFIDTDIITPADTTSFGLGDDEEQRIVIRNAFRPIIPNLYKILKRGAILVAGKSFGIGSHRYQANTVLPMLGFSAVVAESIARIYFRNSIAIGFPAFQVPGISQIVEQGDELEIDMEYWKLRNINSGIEINLEPYNELVSKIIQAGGILRMLKNKIETEKSS